MGGAPGRTGGLPERREGQGSHSQRNTARRLPGHAHRLGAALLTFTAGEQSAPGPLSHSIRYICMETSLRTLRRPTPCSMAARRGVGCLGVWGQQRAPSHSEKWEEAAACRNAAPRPWGSSRVASSSVT